MDLRKEAKSVATVSYMESDKTILYPTKDFPKGYEPVLTVLDEGSLFYGILLCNVREDKFLVALDREVSSVNFEAAMALINNCELFSDEDGKERRKGLRKNAKRHSLVATGDIYKQMREMLKMYTPEPIDYADVFSSPARGEIMMHLFASKKPYFVEKSEAVENKQPDQALVLFNDIWFLVDKHEWKELFYKSVGDGSNIKPSSRIRLILATMRQFVEEGKVTIDVQGALARMHWRPLSKTRTKEIAKSFCALYPMYKLAPVQSTIPTRTDSVFVVLK